jgi:hypothetical protein
MKMSESRDTTGGPGAVDRDQPGLADDVPPAVDLTPGNEATRAHAPGLREDPPEGPLVVDADGAVVDTGSPQDYGEPNADTEDPVPG